MGLVAFILFIGFCMTGEGFLLFLAVLFWVLSWD